MYSGFEPWTFGLKAQMNRLGYVRWPYFLLNQFQLATSQSDAILRVSVPSIKRPH